MVLREGAVLDAQAMEDYCRLHLARYKVPGRIEERPSLPKTSVNKTDKKLIRQWVQH